MDWIPTGGKRGRGRLRKTWRSTLKKGEGPCTSWDEAQTHAADWVIRWNPLSRKRPEDLSANCWLRDLTDNTVSSAQCHGIKRSWGVWNWNAYSDCDLREPLRFQYSCIYCVKIRAVKIEPTARYFKIDKLHTISQGTGLNAVIETKSEKHIKRSLFRTYVDLISELMKCTRDYWCIQHIPASLQRYTYKYMFRPFYTKLYKRVNLNENISRMDSGHLHAPHPLTSPLYLSLMRSLATKHLQVGLCQSAAYRSVNVN